MNKKIILILAFIIILSFSVSALPYNGKGDCSGTTKCYDIDICAADPLLYCAPGYYCYLGACYYPGENAELCENILLGSWTAPNEQNEGCYLDDTWSGKIEGCQDIYTGLLGGSNPVNCYEGSFCVISNLGSPICAPPDYSSKHCEVVYDGAAKWDKEMERCSLNCGDGSCDGAENVQSCPEDCYFGKGECPTGACSGEYTCEEGYSCAPGYYCLDGFCKYSGEDEELCTRLGGLWKNGDSGYGCMFDKKWWSGITEGCINLNEASVAPCEEALYCVETDKKSFCAPPDFSQEHCERVYDVGDWDGENCLKYCGDGSCDGAESYGNCPDDCDPFYGKGKCPSGECDGDSLCTQGDECAPDYYCLNGYCTYPGESQNLCEGEIFGGVWTMGSTYEACLIGDDETVGEVTFCSDETTASEAADTDERNCIARTYCTDIGTKYYCAPPDFSQEHCEVVDLVNGTWDPDEERCYNFCGDDVCDGHEDDESCPNDCTKQEVCVREGGEWIEEYEGVPIEPICCGDGVCEDVDLKCKYCEDLSDCYGYFDKKGEEYDDDYCCGDNFCNSYFENETSCEADCLDLKCEAQLALWSDGSDNMDVKQTPQGYLIYILIIGNDQCENSSVNFSVYNKDNVKQPFGMDEMPAEDAYFFYNEKNDIFFALSVGMVDWDKEEGYYFIIRDNGTNEIIVNSSAEDLFLEVIDEDDWDGEVGDPLDYFDEVVAGCIGAWDCTDASWSECQMIKGEYVAIRDVRKCSLDSNKEHCPIPPSKKSCIQEEEFPFFDWVNVLLVSLMLVSFYFYKFKKFN